jgi:hypothetical protein
VFTSLYPLHAATSEYVHKGVNFANSHPRVQMVGNLFGFENEIQSADFAQNFTFIGPSERKISRVHKCIILWQIL